MLPHSPAVFPALEFLFAAPAGRQATAARPRMSTIFRRLLSCERDDDRVLAACHLASMAAGFGDAEEMENALKPVDALGDELLSIVKGINDRLGKGRSSEMQCLVVASLLRGIASPAETRVSPASVLLHTAVREDGTTAGAQRLLGALGLSHALPGEEEDGEGEGADGQRGGGEVAKPDADALASENEGRGRRRRGRRGRRGRRERGGRGTARGGRGGGVRCGPPGQREPRNRRNRRNRATAAEDEDVADSPQAQETAEESVMPNFDVGFDMEEDEEEEDAASDAAAPAPSAETAVPKPRSDGLSDSASSDESDVEQNRPLSRLRRRTLSAQKRTSARKLEGRSRGSASPPPPLSPSPPPRRRSRRISSDVIVLTDDDRRLSGPEDVDDFIVDADEYMSGDSALSQNSEDFYSDSVHDSDAAFSVGGSDAAPDDIDDFEDDGGGAAALEHEEFPHFRSVKFLQRTGRSTIAFGSMAVDKVLNMGDDYESRRVRREHRDAKDEQARKRKREAKASRRRKAGQRSTRRRTSGSAAAKKRSVARKPRAKARAPSSRAKAATTFSFGQSRRANSGVARRGAAAAAHYWDQGNEENVLAGVSAGEQLYEGLGSSTFAAGNFDDNFDSGYF